MNKKLILVIAVLVLLALGGYYLKTRTTNPQSGIQTTGQVANEAQEFARALESGKPTICTMSKSGDTMEYLIKGKMMKINTTSTTTDEKGTKITTTGHMISDTKFLYTWDDKTKQGSKMAIPTEDESNELEEDAKKFQVDSTVPKLESEADFDTYKNEGYTVACKAGSIDDSLFVPPTDIKFIDPTEMMKALPSPDAAGNIDMSKLKDFEKQFGGLDESADGL